MSNFKEILNNDLEIKKNPIEKENTNEPEIIESETENEKEFDDFNAIETPETPVEKHEPDDTQELLKGAAIAALNVRLNPGLGSEIVGVLFTGEKVLVAKTDDPEWVKVSTPNGLVGYCVKDYISFI